MARLPLAFWLGLVALSLQAPPGDEPGPDLPPLHSGENDPSPGPYILAEERYPAEPPFDQGPPLAPALIRPSSGPTSTAPSSSPSWERLARGEPLESYRCRRLVCTGEGTGQEEGTAWDKDGCTACVCLQGALRGALRGDGPQCPGCADGAARRERGEEWAPRVDPCWSCWCMEGRAVCRKRQCARLCRHPASPRPGTCCPICDGCSLEGRELASGQPCTQGACTSGNVLCEPTACRAPVLRAGECGPWCGGCAYRAQPVPAGALFPPPREPCLASIPQSLPQGLRPPSWPCGAPACSGPDGTVRCLPVTCPPAMRPGQRCPTCPGCHFQGRDRAEGETFPAPGRRCEQCRCLWGKVSCEPLPCPEVTCPHPAAGPCDCPTCDGCSFHGRACSNGERFPDPRNACRHCSCLDGRVTCVPGLCPPAPCASPVQRPGRCCPQCPECRHGGQEHPEGSHWPSPTDPCQRCSCAGGEVRCVTAPCPPLTCAHQVTEPGDCCPRCKGCVVQGRPYRPGETVQPSLDPCEICTCELLEFGGPQVRCYRRPCPSLVGCPRSQVQPPGENQCCATCAQALTQCTAELAGRELPAADDPCHTCRCQDLTWVCVRQGCPPLSCPPAEQFTPQGACCPVCDGCVIEAGERRVADGESWTDSEDDCVSCTCSRGHVECHIAECAPVECQGGLRRVRLPGSCCYQCQDPDGSCSYQGRRYQAGARWPVDACTTCSCVSGEVHCRSQRCPPAACAADEAPTLAPGTCCPRCLPRPATCLAFGDPHYRTFDGRLLNFQGTCTYVLAQDCQGRDFSVHVTNEDRGRPGVAWTKGVTVRVGDTVVQLLQDWLVKVDGQAVALPFLREPHLYVERQARAVLLSTRLGVKVLWSGHSHLELSVPGTYRGRTCGLCGNFNGLPEDDARLPAGQLARSEAAFGNSWRVRSRNGTGGPCADGRDVDPCKEAGYRARKEANARCKVLTAGPFQPCHPLVPPEPFFAACVYDLCACGAGAEEGLCAALEAYAALCRRAGLALHWRSPTLCAVGCPQDRGYVFDECGPPCPRTCYNQDEALGAVASRCFKACVPGCQCPAGLVEHDARCILPRACPRVIHGNR